MTLSVPLVAPNTPGTYSVFWRLISPLMKMLS